MTMASGDPPAVSYIRDIWCDTLDAEMATIREIVTTYPYVSMDTEFPGVVARPIGTFKSSSDFHYQTLRCNVDLLKIIQLGLTFCNEDGELAPGVCTYQFNFKFSLSDDIYAQDSIDLLTRSGIDFKRHEELGIDVIYFAELLISSGIVLCDEVVVITRVLICASHALVTLMSLYTMLRHSGFFSSCFLLQVRWVSFHSGYDFGYLMKLLTCKPLPHEEDDFFSDLKLYFPQIYDIKYLMKSCEGLKGGLNKLAEDLEVERIGPEHQAGSDSLLTQATFFKMRSLFFENDLDSSKHLNILYGLGTGANFSAGKGGGGADRPPGVWEEGNPNP
uniref:poly(A)-specific ribonuclease n=1 Tax=Haptolina ericina TaxID=156174 RepID=A0A6T9FJ50_9EUKA|mmetsp:Transcript_33666/g.76209  ORF Transcript_33666/g.76209 Transcript_33666/m.76209 type:complete len:332 (+) Transcript_33666:117-1112(+)